MSWIGVAVVLSVFFVSVSGQCTCVASSIDGYMCMKKLADYYTLHWAVDDASVSMALVAKGAEWVGISFAEKEDSMEPADAIIGWISEDGIVVLPYRVTSQGVSKSDIDDSVIISSSAVSQVNADTTVEFTRDLEGGSVEIDLDAENTLINYAIGDRDDLIHHGLENRGQTTICLAAQPGEDEEEEPEEEPEEEAETTGCFCEPSDNDKYTCMKKLASYYTLHWKYEDDSISMAMVATNAEWVGVAFAEKEDSMEPADAIIGWISKGELTVLPYRITAQTVSEDDVDDSVIISSSVVSQVNADTTVEFTRDLKGGSVEIDVDAEDTLINYAVGDRDDLIHHGLENRGHTTICIAAQPRQGAANIAAGPAMPPLAFSSEEAEDTADLLGIENDM